MDKASWKVGPGEDPTGMGVTRARQSLMWESQAYSQWGRLMFLSSIAVLCLSSID